jgi:formylglycine-generating enzyme required for sulfatase activity
LSGAAAVDPTGPSSPETGEEARVVKGGYWGRTEEMDRIPVRHGLDPETMVFYVGFRIAQDL